MMEAAIISQDRHRLVHLAATGSRPAKLMQSLLGNMDRLLATLLLFNNLANVLCTTAAIVIVTRLAGGGAGVAFAASLLVAFLILVLSEISPKIVGVRHSRVISLACAVPLKALITIFHPVIAVANFLARSVLALLGIRHPAGLHTALNVPELRSAVRESNRRAQADNDTAGGRHYYMVEQLLRLGDMPVEKIMTPRHRIEGINLQDSDDEIRRQIMETRHSKIPVFDGNLDDARGLVDTLPVIKAVLSDGAFGRDTLQRLQTPPLFIPAAAEALQQMENMRQQSARMALVVDGTGRVTGLVTLSNFAAAVIGDEELPDNAYHTATGDFILPGNFPLLRLGDLHPHLALPETSAASINGLIIETWGGIPEQNMCVHIGDLRMEILESGKNSVKKVRLSLPPTEPPETDKAT